MIQIVYCQPVWSAAAGLAALHRRATNHSPTKGEFICQSQKQAKCGNTILSRWRHNDGVATVCLARSDSDSMHCH